MQAFNHRQTGNTEMKSTFKTSNRFINNKLYMSFRNIFLAVGFAVVVAIVALLFLISPS